MGLAGVKNRRKLAKDPNNTRWSRNEDTFGQKILRGQGWQPGQFLGVQDSAHSAHHTAANSSHIRVTFRDNNAGIGMKMGANDEATGMGAFQDLLGRLNGKSEAKIQLEKKVREDHKVDLYVERKYGGMRFVRGGLLVGDKIKGLEKNGEEDMPREPSGSEQETTQESDIPIEPTEGNNSKKDKKERKEKKVKKRKAEEDEAEAASDGSKKKKRKKAEAKGSDIEMAEAPTTEWTSSIDSTAEEVSKKKKSKKAKEGRSAEKAEKKERRKKEKRTDEEAKEVPITDTKKDKKERKKKRKEKRSNESSAEAEEPTTGPSLATSGESASSGTSTPRHQPVGPRRLHRTRFIASKRAAMMDQTALNQIFMIKSAAGA